MSVPLDRLYNFLHGVCNHDIIIYRFFPHGSKKIEDLTSIEPKPGGNAHWKFRYAICHDQEPLDFDMYDQHQVAEEYIAAATKNNSLRVNISNTSDLINFYKKLNLRMAIDPPFYANKPVLLIHSEKNSENLARYETLGIVGVYWWCHAVIARDWFRHAEHDHMLGQRKPTADFLVYNRAWTGSREYRLKFAELLADNALVNNCNIKFNPNDDGNHYCGHVFKNKDFRISRTNLEEIFELNTADASASADYDRKDYQSTQLEIVLETLFDDQRIQLTEKVLRPIACGHPFMLASTAGSLDYVRSYGFETFGQHIDETYDTIQDPLQRLGAIVAEMQRIANLPQDQKDKLYADLRTIAAKNKQLFFSKEWHDQIVQEFKTNFESARLVNKKFAIDLRGL